MVQEGINVLARRALPLTGVVRLAVKAGWEYLLVDGVNIPTERIAARYTRKQYWYSGKHQRHGGAVQTVADDTLVNHHLPVQTKSGHAHCGH